MARHGCLLGVCLFIGYAFWGCADLRPSTQETLMPLFMPTAEDTSRLSLLTHELDHKARKCVESADCEQVAFARALVELFENRETARASFRRVIDGNPTGPLAGPSRLWVELIDEHRRGGVTNARFNPWPQVAAQLLRDWMDRQVSGQAAFERSSPRPATGSEPPAPREQPMERSRVIEGMQRQLRERDRQLAALRSQLEALKYIDQEHAEKHRKVKPPASLRMTDRDAGESVP
jgi:hypothetical protein